MDVPLMYHKFGYK